MGAMALFVEGASDGTAIAPQAASRLAALGVTRVSVLGDAQGTAIIVEGWALEPERCAEQIQEALFGTAGVARVLTQVANVSLSVARE